MGQRLPKLTVKQVAAITRPGLHGDGAGLYLRVTKTGSKSWIVRIMVHGRRRDLGLGSASLVSLKAAREMAHEMRQVARAGGDPEAVRTRQTMTFKTAALRVHDGLVPTWRSAAHAARWWASLERHVFPIIGNRQIETLGPADVLKVLTPIWAEKNDTARRVKQRMTQIFDWAKTAGHYGRENPVTGINRALPRVQHRPQHMPALPWQELPAFWADLTRRESMSARVLEFIILTAARSGEARGARWAEIEGALWTVPGNRMKMGVDHRVPLSPAALGVLDRVRDMDPALIFPSPIRQKGATGSVELSDLAPMQLMRRMGRGDLTVHGFRSTFRDWAAESAHAPREVAEAALAHAAGKVERAYARSDLFDRRRALMDAWGRYVTGEAGGVVELVRGAI